MFTHVHRNDLCCEAFVRRVSTGELLMVCQCDDVTEPAPKNRVYFWHSADEGVHWTPRQLLAPEDGRATYCTEVSVCGDLIRAYITFHDGNFLKFECAVYQSVDGGHTWVEEGPIPLLKGFVFPRGVILTREGRLLLPYQHYPISREEEAKILSLPEPHKIWNSNIPFVENGALISLDGGKTYHRSQKDALLPLYLEDGSRKWVWSEPTIVELSDGTIVMLLRFDGRGYLYRSDSKDGGETWSDPIKTEIPNPANKPKLLRDGKRIVLINTPDPICGFIHRKPLEAWISEDDMKTWSKKVTLLDFPGWISYPDGFLEDGTLYLAFEFNRHDLYFLKTKLW